jgi:hypothetical protein
VSDDESTGPQPQRKKKKRQLSKRKRKQLKRWVLDKKFGVWVPKRCIVMDKSKHTRREKLADGAERVRRWFLGSQNKFSKRAKRTITITTLAAVGASDFGVQSVIFGCLKALTDELRFGLTHKQLANACPSVKTLRNWEFQLAGGCLATVINQAKESDIKHIKPMSHKLKQWMPKQWAIYKRRKGLVMDTKEEEALQA